MWHSDNQINDDRKWWEYLKYKIRNFTIRFSKDKARAAREHVKNLEESLKGLKLDSEIDKNIYNNLTAQLEKHYEWVTDGIIVRSRCQWYEEGERNSKYFLSLERNNKNKSNIRKLLVNGFEITNQKTILQEIFIKIVILGKYV